MIQKKNLIIITVSIFLALSAVTLYVLQHKTQSTFKIGILHSLTGKFSVYEKPIINATILAVEEINNQGGVLGRQIEPVVRDGKSTDTVFAQEADYLITQEKVAALFGCWSSQDRKAVKSVVEQYNSLLFYPVQNEGLEDSPNIVYTSTIPNQQAIPAITWCLQNLGTSFFLVGSDELFPRATHAILKDTIELFEGTVVGEEYLTRETDCIDKIVEKIKRSEPNVIVNTIIGPSNKSFFQTLRHKGITSEKIPTMSLCIDETELQALGEEYMIGDYSCWSHFQSTQRPENRDFVQRIKKRFGQDYVVSDAMEAAYYGVYLWKQAVTNAQTINTADVQTKLKNQAFDAPEGIVYVDDSTLHTWSVMAIGKIRSDKQFTVLWNSVKAIKPMVYPFFKSKEEWEALLDEWYKQWGNKWSN